ncbi:MAG: LPS-assembly protein LptD [Reichenbachiella sp.]
MPNIKYFIFSFLLFSQALQGRTQTLSIDTLQVLDSLQKVAISNGLLDSLANHPEYQQLASDSLQSLTRTIPSTYSMPNLNDSTSLLSNSKAKGDVETTIDYESKDSIFFDLKSQKMYLYGDSKIVYGDITLTAENINVDWVDNSLEAVHIKDSTGRKVGKPVFKESGETYETDDMKYNFKTRKAIINGIITEQDGAFMHGSRVKKNEFDEMFIRGAKYTTCDHENPHFHISSTKLKVIPNNKVLSGPFNLYFGDIPTPIGFPFGMFPQPKEKASGIIFPSYGEDQNRGFFLRQMGYYFAINDYMDLKLTTDIFSKGSYGIQAGSRYKVRYRYSGNVNLQFNKNVNPGFEDDGYSNDYKINWSHSPESRGTSRFSASVSAQSSTFTQNNNNIGQNYNTNVNAQFNSNITYSKTFKGTPFNMTANARHTQNISTGQVGLTLPEISLNASRISPFKNIDAVSDNFIGKLGFTYKMSMKNELSNAALSIPNYVINADPLSDSIIGFNMDNMSQLMDRAKQGVRHQIPISTSFNVLNNFTVSPSFNYTEVWYPKELQYTYVAEEEGVRIDTLDGFSRAGWYSSGASVSTRLYGFYPIGGKKIQAIRHVITPNVGFSYSPDFGDPARGNYDEVQISDDPDDTRILSKYQGFAYGGPSLGESASLSFSLNNNIEMKVKTKNDSIDEYEKVKIFDNISISSGYNFLADSFALSNINWNARTSLFKNKISINLSGTLDPYTYVLDSVEERTTGDVVHDRKLDQFAWNTGNGLGNLSRLSVAIGMNLGPKGSSGNSNRQQNGANPTAGGLADPNGDLEGNFQAGNVNQFISNDANMYVPFEMPWKLSINYSLNYTKSGLDESNITQTLNFSGNLNLTNKTQINASSGYDLEKYEFTFTQLSVARDLHCWNISFNWVPFGPRQSYFVAIQVNSALLSDLKLDRRNQPRAQVF